MKPQQGPPLPIVHACGAADAGEDVVNFKLPTSNFQILSFLPILSWWA
jgi:hypothetical protein